MHALLRVDGGPTIGYGHLMRMRALTEALQAAGHAVRVATATPAPARAVADLLSHDFILGNIHRAGLDYLRLLSQNVALYAQEACPPSDSIVAEEVAAGLLEDPDKANLKPMSPTDRDRMETCPSGVFRPDDLKLRRLATRQAFGANRHPTDRRDRRRSRIGFEDSHRAVIQLKCITKSDYCREVSTPESS